MTGEIIGLQNVLNHSLNVFDIFSNVRKESGIHHRKDSGSVVGWP